MNYNFLVLINGVGSNNGLFAVSVPPAVYVNGIAVGVFTDIDTVAVVGAVMLRGVRLGVRGRICGRRVVPQCSACAAPKDKAHHTEDTGQS